MGGGLSYNVTQEAPVATTMVHVRLDMQTKLKAAKALEGMGLSLSDAVRMFLVRVAAEKQLPFTPRVPNAQTRAAMAEAEALAARPLRFEGPEGLFLSLEAGETEAK